MAACGEERAAPHLLGDVPGILWIPGTTTVEVGRLTVEELADMPLGDQRLDVLEETDPAQFEAHARLHTRIGDRRDHVGQARGIERHGLLDHHVLPRARRRDRLVGMHRMRAAENDDVEVGVGQERVELVVGPRACDAMGSDLGRGTRLVAREHRRHVTAFDLHEVVDVCACNPSGSDDAYTKLLGHFLLSVLASSCLAPAPPSGLPTVSPARGRR